MATMITPPASATLLDCSRSLSAFTHYSTSDSSPDLYDTAAADAVITPDTDNDDDTSPRDRQTPARSSFVLKIEELEDNGNAVLDSSPIDAKPPPADDEQEHQAQPPPPRKRGRPRKHPIVEQKKTAHARSKTGCATCRRRKKKCDETKPSCLNCEKNNVVCDGYEPKQPWRSGKQKALMKADVPVPVAPIQIVPAGVEGAVDRMFVEHFTSEVGKRLSLTDNGNPFLGRIFQMAQNHVGLMHGLMYLSGSSLISKSTNPNFEWFERSMHHSNKAINLLHEDIERMKLGEQDDSRALVSVQDHSLAQSLILCLQTVAAGDTSGQYKLHLQAIKEMLRYKPGTLNDTAFRRVILEFVIYHDYSSSITSLDNPLDTRSHALMDEFKLPEYMIQPQAGTLLGVLDGLFAFISRIRSLRDTIRGWNKRGIPFWSSSDFTKIKAQVDDLQQRIQDWVPNCAPDSPRYEASLLYRQCTHIYLLRTVSLCRPQDMEMYRTAVEEGLRHLRKLPWDMDEISTQSILLMPLFLLGCAAFDPQQRPEIDDAFQRLQDWSNFGNIKNSRLIIQELWRMMDNGQAEQTWDWETIMDEKKMYFLVT